MAGVHKFLTKSVIKVLWKNFSPRKKNFNLIFVLLIFLNLADNILFILFYLF